MKDTAVTSSTKSLSDQDNSFMTHAIALGEKMRGTTKENPAVGCLIVANEHGKRRNTILAAAHTAQGGRPHAEIRALEQAGEKAKGATLYVSLEPCAHTGNTPPCARAVVDSGIRRVVSAIQDPDERVAGKGHRIIRDAGVELITGVQEKRARYAHRGFFSRKIKKRPYVTLKLALSQDGKIAAENNIPTRITGAHANAYVHKLRAHNNAIMIGRKTAKSDNPQLTCRLPGLEHLSPIRIIMDSTAQSLPHPPITKNNTHNPPIWILTAHPVSPHQTDSDNVKTVTLDADPNGKTSVKAALTYLAQQGINHLLVEGGATLAAAFIRSDMVDEIIILRASHEIGAQGVDALRNMRLENILNSDMYRLIETKKLNPDTLTRYVRNGNE